MTDNPNEWNVTLRARIEALTAAREVLTADNARLREALTAMLDRHILYCGGPALPYAGHTDGALFARARAALTGKEPSHE